MADDSDAPQPPPTTQLDTDSVYKIWHALVRTVATAHAENILHRDLKPQNFLLVPVSPFADRILAQSPTPPKDFRFRLLGEERRDDGTTTSTLQGGGGGPDVELTLTDAATNTDVTIQLMIKLSDFGLSRPLEVDASHLSVQGRSTAINIFAFWIQRRHCYAAVQCSARRGKFC